MALAWVRGFSSQVEELRYYLDLPQLGGLRRSRQVLRKLLKMSEPMQAEADFSNGWWRGWWRGAWRCEHTEFYWFCFSILETPDACFREKTTSKQLFKMATCEPWWLNERIPNLLGLTSRPRRENTQVWLERCMEDGLEPDRSRR